MNNALTIGIDEVGRGPWAGPLVAAAVCVSRDVDMDGITDSKQLTPPKRESCLHYIRQHATAIGIGWASPASIDRNGLTPSTRSVMHTAWLQLPMRYRNHTVLIDGDTDFLAGTVTDTRCIPQGDQSEFPIAAASIVAKVLRDQFMRVQSRIFPGYGFDSHVGYGTRQHKAALEEYGPCLLHRHSFAPVKTVSNK